MIRFLRLWKWMWHRPSDQELWARVQQLEGARSTLGKLYGVIDNEYSRKKLWAVEHYIDVQLYKTARRYFREKKRQTSLGIGFSWVLSLLILVFFMGVFYNTGFDRGYDKGRRIATPGVIVPMTPEALVPEKTTPIPRVR